MNTIHLHLIVNHFPIIFPIVGIIVMVTGIIAKSEAVKRTAWMIFILGALSSILAMATGEAAEEVVEKMNDVAKKYIKIHEKKAELFAVLSYILGGISLLGLWASFKQKSFSFLILIITLVFAVVLLFFAQQTGTSGGEIQHTEIRSENK